MNPIIYEFEFSYADIKHHMRNKNRNDNCRKNRLMSLQLKQVTTYFCQLHSTLTLVSFLFDYLKIVLVKLNLKNILV